MEKEAVKKYTSVAVPFLLSTVIFNILPELIMSYAATFLNYFFGLAQEDLEFRGMSLGIGKGTK